MFSYVLAAVLACALPSPDKIPVTYEFELNKPYLEVLPRLLSNQEKIMDQAGESVIESKDPVKELVYNNCDGFYLEHSQISIVDMKHVGEVCLKQSVAVKRGCVVIKEKLWDDNDYLSEYNVVIEIRRNGLKTVVTSRYWVSVYNSPRIVSRGIAHSVAKKIEKAVREAVEDVD